MESNTRLLDAFRFLPESASPMYMQLASFFRHQIKLGHLKPGDRMVTENEIAQGLGISRTTVRLALGELVDEGMIVRYRGKGTYVAQNRLRRNINYMYNFTENIRDAGALPSSIVLTCQVETADAAVKAELSMLGQDAQVFHLLRLRCADGHPVILEETYIPYELCQGIEQIDFTTASLYDVLQKRYFLTLTHAEETIEAIIIQGEAAAKLNVRGKMPGYRITRVSHLDSGYPFEYTRSVTRADKCIFKLDLYNNRAAGKNGIDFGRQLKP